MSMQYIREAYGVPAKRGARVAYSGSTGNPLLGTITGSKGARLLIRLDGTKHSAIFHPTWEMRYLDEPVTRAAAAIYRQTQVQGD